MNTILSCLFPQKRTKSVISAVSTHNLVKRYAKHTEQPKSIRATGHAYKEGLSQISREATSVIDIVEPSKLEDRILYLGSQNIEFERVKGSGNFSDIYQCRMAPNRGDSIQPGQVLAVKRVNLKDTKNKNFTRKFLPREILIHSSITHPNIVEYINTLVTPTDAYLVMELVPLQNLFDYCKAQGRLPLDKVFAISTQLISALSYLHGQDIVHRDIKCENIVFKSYQPPQIKLLDFGFSKRLGASVSHSHSCTSTMTLQQVLDRAHGVLKTSTSSVDDLRDNDDAGGVSRLCNVVAPLSLGISTAIHKDAVPAHLTKTFCGSLAYVAPEMLREPRTAYDPKKTDVWSVGVLIYVIATHRMPYKEAHGMNRLRKELNSPVVWPRDFDSPEFQATIQSILTISLERRPTIFQIPDLPWFKRNAALVKKNTSPSVSFLSLVSQKMSPQEGV